MGKVDTLTQFSMKSSTFWLIQCTLILSFETLSFFLSPSPSLSDSNSSQQMPDVFFPLPLPFLLFCYQYNWQWKSTYSTPGLNKV
jgi:hypothetical protein